MSRQALANSIKQVITSGGTVSFPEKRSWQTWISTVRLYLHRGQLRISDCNQRDYPGIDQVIDEFISRIFTLSFDGIRRRAADPDSEELDEISKEAVVQYNKEFFDVDYPFGEGT